MPFDIDAPLHGKDGDPNHKPYSRSTLLFANGFPKPGKDGDPPTEFYTADDFWKLTDTLPDNSDPGKRAYGFRWTGGVVSGAQSDAPFTLVDDFECQYAMVFPLVGGTTDDIVVNFEYKGDPVLNTPLTIPAGDSAYSVHYSTDFALDTLVAVGLDLYRPLFAVCTTAAGADADARLQQVLVVKRIAA